VSSGDDRAIYLWDAATHEKVRTFAGVDARVMHLAVSPDGALLAGVAADGRVRLWELATGKALADAAGKGSGLGVVAFSRGDGLLAAAGLGAGVHLWGGASRTRLPSGKWPGEDSIAVALAFAPDGMLAMATRDAIIRLGRPGGAEGGRVKSPTQLVRSLFKAKRPAGGEEVARFTGHQMRINALAFTPDGKSLVSGSDDGTMVIWDVPRRNR
jgi:WD40 repeat protein